MVCMGMAAPKTNISNSPKSSKHMDCLRRASKCYNEKTVLIFTVESFSDPGTKQESFLLIHLHSE